MDIRLGKCAFLLFEYIRRHKMLEKIRDKWNDILMNIKEEHELSDVSYKTWLLPLKLHSAENGKVFVLVPDANFLGYIKKKYGLLLQVAIEEMTGYPCEVEFIIENQIKDINEPKNQLIHNTASSVDQAAIQNANLNPRYTFDTFVVGANNNLAHAASLAVAESPGEIYNPLFIYGNSGLGKTHLLNAIGHELKKNFPDKDIIYVKGDQFANELIEAIRAGTTVSFREKYRKADALLIDDIQFIAGKESTQEEFFHTFNTLYESKKQIVLTSDRPPRDIATLEDRLKTRFEWGLTADVQPPDFETRMAIIKRKAELVGLSVPDNVCEFIAQKLKSNIRQLEGTVKKLNAIHLVEGATPTISTAQRAISDIVNNEQPAPVTVSKIIEEVGRTYGVSPEDIKSSKRNANVSFARQISMYVVREITQMPMVEIGKEFGGRDHSTVVYAIQQIEEKSARDPVTKATVSDIIKNIRDR